MLSTEISKVLINFRGMMVCVVMLLPLSVHAGDTLSQPSDVDLHVAYCLGVQEVVFTHEKNKTSDSDPFISDFHRRKARLAQAVLDILNIYLDRHLPLVEKADMNDASKRGVGDAKMALTDQRLSSCFDAYAQQPVDGLTSSIDNRRVALPRCVAEWRRSFPELGGCDGLTWLHSY